MHWQEMNKAPRTGERILAYANVGGQDLVSIAFWVDGEHWEMQGFDSKEELMGWWTYDNSVSQRKLDGIYTPQLWTEYYPPGSY